MVSDETNLIQSDSKENVCILNICIDDVKHQYKKTFTQVSPLSCGVLVLRSKQSAQNGEKREKWLAVSPFSSWRNVRRGQALGGEEKQRETKRKKKTGPCSL